MPRGAPQRGDFTGQERQRLTEEKAQELAERQKEIGLVNQVDLVVEEEGIFDPVTGQLVELPPEAEARIAALEEPIEVEQDPIFDPTQTGVYQGQSQRAANLTDTLTKPRAKPPASNHMEIEDLGEEPIVVEDEWRIIRVNTDVEDMTYGVGNTLTFLRGRRYRVPQHLYEWLESRGVVYH
jgi:hypothetical protein